MLISRRLLRGLTPTMNPSTDTSIVSVTSWWFKKNDFRLLFKSLYFSNLRDFAASKFDSWHMVTSRAIILLLEQIAMSGLNELNRVWIGIDPGRSE